MMHLIVISIAAEKHFSGSTRVEKVPVCTYYGPILGWTTWTISS